MLEDRVLRLYIGDVECGTALLLWTESVLLIEDTKWIALLKPIQITLPWSASAQRIFDVVEKRLIAFLVIMVIAPLAQRNRNWPLRGRAAQVIYGAVLTIGAIGALGALAIIVLLAVNR